jgi:hypothetical protein
MNSDFLRKENESFLDYADRLIINRIEYDLDKTEVYELLYGEQVSADHARKCLTNLERTIEESKKTKVEKQIHSDFNDKDLEKELGKNYKNVVELNKDGSQSSDKLLVMSEEECKDVNYLLKAHGYDINAWELISARNNIWNVYSKVDGVQTLYSSKIVVKPRTDFIWTEEIASKVFNNLKSEYKNKIIVSEQYSKNDNALIVPIADFHYGLFSDMLSNGNDYNLEIAEKLFYEVINDIKNRNINKKFEKVVFIVGNDFINADNLSNTTTKGTPQDNTSLWFTIVERATQLIVNGIDMLSTIAPVDVRYVTSNHDLHTMFGIMQTIKAHYRNDNNITIDTSPLPRKYYKFGKTLLALSHDIKVKEALKIVSTEAKSEWSDCDHIICMLAHLHQSMVYEKQGYLEILRLPTISGWSRWTNQMGYIQTEKKNQAFIINGKNGITDIINTILE